MLLLVCTWNITMVGLALSIEHLTAERDFDSRDQTNTQGLELAEKKSYCPCHSNG